MNIHTFLAIRAPNPTPTYFSITQNTLWYVLYKYVFIFIDIYTPICNFIMVIFPDINLRLFFSYSCRRTAICTKNRE